MKKNNMRLLTSLFCFLLILSGCYPEWAQASATSSSDIQQIYAEVGELKRKLSGYDLEIQLMQEQVRTKSPKTNLPQETLAKIEERIAKLEKFQEKAAQDLRTLHRDLEGYLSTLDQYKSKLQNLDQEITTQNEQFRELGKLKHSLSSLSKAMDKKPHKIHKVRSGDTLEKLANHYGTTSEEIKKINQLSSDTIIIGQELKIPQ